MSSCTMSWYLTISCCTCSCTDGSLLFPTTNTYSATLMAQTRHPKRPTEPPKFEAPSRKRHREGNTQHATRNTQHANTQHANQPTCLLAACVRYTDDTTQSCFTRLRVQMLLDFGTHPRVVVVMHLWPRFGTPHFSAAVRQEPRENRGVTKRVDRKSEMNPHTAHALGHTNERQAGGRLSSRLTEGPPFLLPDVKIMHGRGEAHEKHGAASGERCFGLGAVPCFEVRGEIGDSESLTIAHFTARHMHAPAPAPPIYVSRAVVDARYTEAPPCWCSVHMQGAHQQQQVLPLKQGWGTLQDPADHDATFLQWRTHARHGTHPGSTSDSYFAVVVMTLASCAQPPMPGLAGAPPPANLWRPNHSKAHKTWRVAENRQTQQLR